ncbi:MAG: hypothetical protein Q8L15_18460 [Methylobacter sp.]|nr:hypothetical protein [Methylobacter sp.]
MAEKKDVDWQEIEREYRANIRSLRDIASQYEISEALIRRKAKTMLWVRDVSAKISARAQDILIKESVRNDGVRAGVRTEERDIIESAAQLQVAIIREHRRDITRYRSLCENLLQEIELQTGEKITFDQLGEIMASGDESSMDRIYKKVLSTGSRVDSVKKLVDTLKVLIGLERQAFGLSDNSNGNADKQSLDDIFSMLTGNVLGVKK